jgi:predicted transcriptional regulator
METTVEKKREIVIRVKMMERGITGAAIARSLGITTEAVNKEIQGIRTSSRIRRALCDTLELNPAIWGKEGICHG